MRVDSFSPRGLIAGAVNLLYPSNCPSCGLAADDLSLAPLCRKCWEEIKKYVGPSCKICSVPLASGYASTCGSCIKDPPSFSRSMSFGLYAGVMAHAINSFKFGGARRLYKPLGEFLLDYDMTGTDAVVPVPLSIGGLRERGFNQSLLLSKYISDRKKVPLIMDGLIKKTETRPQVGLSAKERLSNLKGAFVYTRDFKDLRVLLVDDVMTTGTTLNLCAKELRKAGAAEVVVLTLARAGVV